MKNNPDAFKKTSSTMVDNPSDNPSDDPSDKLRKFIRTVLLLLFSLNTLSALTYVIPDASYTPFVINVITNATFLAVSFTLTYMLYVSGVAPKPYKIAAIIFNIYTVVNLMLLFVPITYKEYIEVILPYVMLLVSATAVAVALKLKE